MACRQRDKLDESQTKPTSAKRFSLENNHSDRNCSVRKFILSGKPRRQEDEIESNGVATRLVFSRIDVFSNKPPVKVPCIECPRNLEISDGRNFQSCEIKSKK